MFILTSTCLPMGINSRESFARKTNKLTTLHKSMLLSTSYSLYVRLFEADSFDNVWSPWAFQISLVFFINVKSTYNSRIMFLESIENTL